MEYTALAIAKEEEAQKESDNSGATHHVLASTLLEDSSGN